MPVGLQIINDSGYIQIDDTYRNLQLVQIIPVSIPTGTGTPRTITFTGSNAAVLVARNQGLVYAMCDLHVDAGGTNYTGYVYYNNGTGSAKTMYFYLFDTVDTVDTHGVGLEVFDPTGKPVYSSKNKNMSVSTDFSKELGMFVYRKLFAMIPTGPGPNDVAIITRLYRINGGAIEFANQIIARVQGAPGNYNTEGYFTVDLTNYPTSL